MPLFTYKCKKCEKTFDAIEKYESRDNAQECPNCGGKTGARVEQIEGVNYSLNRQFSRMRHGN